MNSSDYYGLKSPAFKDRSGWLAVFGASELVLALICLGFMLSMIVAARSFETQRVHSSLKVLAILAVMYGVLCLAFIAGAIGTFIHRNWGRVLMVIVSAFWLGIGVFSTAIAAASQAFVPPNQRQTRYVLVVGLVIVAFCMVVIPAIFLRFYTLTSVKAIFRATVRPAASQIPVSIWIAAGFMILSADTLWGTSHFFPIFTFFGLILTGKMAQELMLIRAALDAVICALFLKRDANSWRAAVWLTIISGASNLVTNLLRSPQEIYARAPWVHPERLRMSSFWFSSTYRFGVTTALTFAYLLLLIYTRKHFAAATPERVEEHGSAFSPQ